MWTASAIQLHDKGVRGLFVFSPATRARAGHRLRRGRDDGAPRQDRPVLRQAAEIPRGAVRGPGRRSGAVRAAGRRVILAAEVFACNAISRAKDSVRPNLPQNLGKTCLAPATRPAHHARGCCQSVEFARSCGSPAPYGDLRPAIKRESEVATDGWGCHGRTAAVPATLRTGSGGWVAPAAAADGAGAPAADRCRSSPPPAAPAPGPKGGFGPRDRLRSRRASVSSPPLTSSPGRSPR